MHRHHPGGRGPERVGEVLHLDDRLVLPAHGFGEGDRRIIARAHHQAQQQLLRGVPAAGADAHPRTVDIRRLVTHRDVLLQIQLIDGGEQQQSLDDRRRTVQPVRVLRREHLTGVDVEDAESAQAKILRNRHPRGGDLPAGVEVRAAGTGQLHRHRGGGVLASGGQGVRIESRWELLGKGAVVGVEEGIVRHGRADVGGQRQPVVLVDAVASHLGRGRGGEHQRRGEK